MKYQLKITRSFKTDYKKHNKQETQDSDGSILMMTCYRISSHTNIFDIKKSQKSKFLISYDLSR